MFSLLLEVLGAAVALRVAWRLGQERGFEEGARDQALKWRQALVNDLEAGRIVLGTGDTGDFGPIPSERGWPWGRVN